MSLSKIRPIAIHLPQYHPIPENDIWWGKGFTEWANVTRAKPLFKGHYQPHLPADLGLYDLRVAEVREEQAKMAKEFGIYGFCYYHYWFNGKKLLERPVHEILKSLKPDFPFMLCWANENWTRRWDGQDQEILMEQNYSAQDDIEHITYLLEYFKDPRYIKVGSKPVFVVYKPYLFPNPSETAERWRTVAREYGIELYLCHTVFGYNPAWSKPVAGFDAVIDFEPFGIRRPNIFDEIGPNQRRNINIIQKIIIKLFNILGRNKKIFPVQYNQVPYKWMYEHLKPLKDFPFKVFPSAVPGWDNTARRGINPTLILDGTSPELFENWLQTIKDDFEPFSETENFVFINAWNEWAEGNHLEPCQKWGSAYLEKVKKIFS